MEGSAEESGRREEGARTVEEQRHVIRVGLGGGVGLHRAPLLPLLLLILGRLGKLLGRLRLGPGEAHPLLMSRSREGRRKFFVLEYVLPGGGGIHPLVLRVPGYRYF